MASDDPQSVYVACVLAAFLTSTSLLAALTPKHLSICCKFQFMLGGSTGGFAVCFAVYEGTFIIKDDSLYIRVIHCAFSVVPP
jgi:hypothetical protein